MKILTLTTGVLGVNTYFLVNEETGEAVAIDCGERYSDIKKFEKDNGITVKYELLTHSHFDHSASAVELQKDGVKVFCSEIDAEKLKKGETLAEHFYRKPIAVTPDYTFKDGDVLNLCGIEITVMITPGHTDGSACFVAGNDLFSGDTLFYESCGRTDFPSGSSEDMKKSLERLFSLDGDYKVYTGHGEATTLSHERAHNPFGGF